VTTRDSPDHPQRIYVVDEAPFTGRMQAGRMLNAVSGPVQGDYPSWTPDNHIVYKGCDYTVIPQSCGLFIVPVAGGDFKQLTTNPNDTAPAASGGRIAFTSNRDGNWEIYIMNYDGSGVKRLTSNAANDGLPVWSLDGKTIAFVSDQGGAWAIWAMSPDGSNRRKLFDIGGGGLAAEWQRERISWGQ
jgi:beta propeller repeat protein